MRVVLAPSAYYPHVGGIEELTRQLALELQGRGHDVSVLTNRWPSGVARAELLDGVRVTRLPFPLPAASVLAAARFLVAAPQAALRLVRELRKTSPDVVHVIGAGPQAAYLTALARPLRLRIVFTAQGELTFDAQSVFQRSATLRASLRRLLRRADAVTACSMYVLDALSSVGPIRSKALVVPNGVTPEDFAEGTAEPAARPYVLALGRLAPQKGFDVLIDAFAHESMRPLGLDLVIAGDGSERDRLATQAGSLGLGDRVRLIGSVGRYRLPSLLAGAELFAFPSRGEPFGIALLEAMAAGVPSVATDAGGVGEFARNEENSLLVAPDDADALAQGLLRLHGDAELRARVSAAGQATAAGLSWSVIAPRYESLYREVAGAARRST